MNDVMISGKFIDIVEIYEDVHIGLLENEEVNVYVFWGKDEFQSQDDKRTKHVVVEGRLQHIKIRSRVDGNVKKLLAIQVRRMELYDF